MATHFPGSAAIVGAGEAGDFYDDLVLAAGAVWVTAG